MATPHNRVQPMDFRYDETRAIMQRWRASESSSLVGVGSIGKSNLLRHVANPDTIRHFLQDSADNFKAIIIDPNLLGALPTTGESQEQFRCWAGHELIMRQLYIAYMDTLSPKEADSFYELYQAMQDGTNPLFAYMGVRYLELALEMLFNKGARIVFMLDEFEEMLKQLPIRFFLNLRGLRDGYKKRLSYLTFTRAPIHKLVSLYDIDRLAIEPFTELFTDNIHYVGPYNESDGHRMIENLMQRNQKRYNDHVVTFLYNITGGFAGLIRSTFGLIEKVHDRIPETGEVSEELLRNFLQRSNVREECRTIWMSLTSPEQHVLRVAAGITELDSNPESQDAVSMLIHKKLLVRDTLGKSATILPPIFREFIETTRPEEH